MIDLANSISIIAIYEEGTLHEHVFADRDSLDAAISTFEKFDRKVSKCIVINKDRCIELVQLKPNRKTTVLWRNLEPAERKT
jgi:hypothetical protein